VSVGVEEDPQNPTHPVRSTLGRDRKRGLRSWRMDTLVSCRTGWGGSGHIYVPAPGRLPSDPAPLAVPTSFSRRRNRRRNVSSYDLVTRTWPSDVSLGRKCKRGSSGSTPCDTWYMTGEGVAGVSVVIAPVLVELLVPAGHSNRIKSSRYPEEVINAIPTCGVGGRRCARLRHHPVPLVGSSHRNRKEQSSAWRCKHCAGGMRKNMGVIGRGKEGTRAQRGVAVTLIVCSRARR